MKKLFLLIVVFVFVSGYTLIAQTTVITGTVSSSVEGEGPIPGVTVIVKGTTIGAITDINGKYSITAPSNAATLTFSYIGMKAQDIEIGGRTVIDAILQSELIGLNEVIVTALGIKREKREVTYQTQKVGNEELSVTQPTRAGSALAGKVAGLQINVQDNGVNPNTQVVLRGFRSISAGNQALVVIDGGISSLAAFDDLNPNDISDLSILKGATAAALYGSRAGNGAIIVTTKKGAYGKKYTVGLISAYTAEKVAYMPKFQSSYGTGWEGAYDAVENTNWGPRYDGTLRQIGPTWPDGSYQEVPYAPVKNNLLDFYNTGNNFNNTFYLSGGSESSKFYLSLGDQRANGIVPSDTYQRNTFRANASKKIGNVELSVNSSFFNDKTSEVGSTIGDQDRPLYWFLINTSTNIPLSKYSDWRNDKYSTPDGYYNAYYQNPYWAVDNNRDGHSTSRLNANVQLSWDILDWLNLTGRIAANNVWGSGKNWRAPQTYDADLKSAMKSVTSFVEDSEFQQAEYVSDLLLSSNFKFADAITLKAILGATNLTHDYRTSTIRANNLSIPDFYDISNGTGSPVVTPNEEHFINYGFFGDFTLGYNNFVFLNFSGRNDWTSTLAPGNNSYFYPSVGLSFVATDAFDALKNNNFLTFAKATISNSTVYNDLNAYLLNESYSKSTNFPYGSINGFFLTNTTVDANIKKEKLNTTEVGLNLGFLKSRLSLDFSYFWTKTTDLITNTTPSYASAATAFLTNIGELDGKGFELTLGGTVVKAKDFSWDLSLNVSHNETIVKEIKEGLDEIALRTTGQWGIYAVKGEAFPQVKANTYQRDPQGRIIIDASSGAPLENATLSSLGKTMPNVIWGVNSGLKFKGFALSTTMDYRTGHVFYAQGSDAMEFTGRSFESISSNRQDFVVPNSVINTGTEANPVYVANTNIPVSGGRQSYWTDVYNIVKENYVKDATAFKIRELALNYSLPSSILSKTPLQKITVGFIARNLFTLLPKENSFSDPEFNNTNDNSVGVGGYFQSPPTKSFGFNINIEF